MSRKAIYSNAMKTAVSLLVTVILMTGLLSTMARADAAASETEKTKSGFFDNPEINRLVDESHEKVEQDGYAELQIPLSLHKIEETVFSDNALKVGHTLLDAGYSAYIIGGTMRDIILGTEGRDIDITTNATIEEQRELFGDALSTHETQGMVFGAVTFPDEEVDLATFQNIPKEFKDLPGVPEFDPDKKTGDSVLHDSFQRDLSINAIYYDLSNGDILDFHDGINDIREGILKTMVNADIKLQSDPRALLRSIRFKARYGFDFSDDLEAAIRENGKKYVKNIGRHDAFSNVRKMMCAGYSLDAYHLLDEYDLFESLYPPLKDAAQDQYYRTYIESALSYMDQQVNSTGENVSDEMTVLVFLEPEILHRAEKSTMDAALKEVLDEQEEVFELENTREGIVQTSLLLERMMAKSSQFFTDSISKSPYFSDALMLLNMMSLVDESLSEQAVFWNRYAETVEDEPELNVAA